MSAAIRVSPQTHAELKFWAKVKGMSIGDLLAEAWKEWLARQDEAILKAATEPPQSPDLAGRESRS